MHEPGLDPECKTKSTNIKCLLTHIFEAVGNFDYGLHIKQYYRVDVKFLEQFKGIIVMY